MIAKRIIPCLDIKNGRVVKGINFVEMRDVGDPVEAAAAYEKAGADEIAFLDITATNQGRSTVVELAARVAKQISIPFTVGGGIRSIEDFRQVFSCGADKVSINTAAIDMPELISKAADEFGKQRIMVAIDAGRRQDGTGWDVYKNGGEINTGLDAIEWAARVEGLGAGEILLTSIDRDGTKEGYDIELTAAVAQKVGIPVIASGGAGNLQDFADAIIMGKADAVLAASLFHFHEVDIKQLKEFLAAQGLPVRQDFE